MSFKKFIVAGDSHGELIDKESFSKLMGFCDTWKPHIRVDLGDLWDFATLRGGASPDDKTRSLSEDYQAGIRYLETYRPNLLTLGNHDARIWEWSHSKTNGVIRDHCKGLVDSSVRKFKQLKITWIPYKVGAYLQLPDSKVKLIHGFHSGVNPAKMHFERYGQVIHGHVHAPNQYTARHVEGGEAHSIGCIGDIEQMDYADRHTAKLGWRQGFAYGIINTKTGDTKIWHVTKEGDAWISPQGII